MRAHIATESRHRDSTATAAGPESRRAYQPSAPATAMMQSRWQPFRLSAHNHTHFDALFQLRKQGILSIYEI